MNPGSRLFVQRQPDIDALTILIHSLLIGLLIVLYRQGVWIAMGERFWYADRLIAYPILFALQWVLLPADPAFHRWLPASMLGFIVGVICTTVVIPPVLDSIKTVYFPTPPRLFIPREYYLIQDMIICGVLGLGVGSGQALCLKFDPDDTSWWWIPIPLTILAYSINTLWWHSTQTWPVGM